MQLVLLSGGSGKRLWPLSNDSYSKQFLRLLPAPDGGEESMVQRVVRQIKSSALGADITIATGESQRDAISCQLGDTVGVVTEPERRDTFPAIALACLYLSKQKGCAADEPVVVMPSDPYIDDSYFDAIGRMVEAVKGGVANLVLMGIRPDYPSTKFGYIVPEAASGSNVADAMRVKRFTEKPTAEKAVELISLGALWNGGVFAFRLGYLLEIISKYVDCGHSFDDLRSCYSCFPKISFDYEVAEKADSVAVVPFAGVWKDLGTWNALSEVLGSSTIGKSTLDSASVNTHVVNRLGIPCLCIGAKNLVVAASPDGILVADKDCCESIKPYVERLCARPMFEERRWGTYNVLEHHHGGESNSDTLVKHIFLKAGKNISYQAHNHRSEVWTFIEGEGELMLDGEVTTVRRGDVVNIAVGQKHAVRAVTELRFVEVQLGSPLIEEDIVRYEMSWPVNHG